MTTQSEKEGGSKAPDPQSTGSAPWTAWAYRVPITVTAVVLFNQAILAGQFMAGTFESLSFHRIGASVADVVVLLAIVGAVLARRRGHYPRWPIGVTVLLLLVLQVQEFAGEERLLALHIPLGVFLIMSVSWLTIWAWRES